MKRLLLVALPLLFSPAALAQPDPDAQGMGKDMPVTVPALGLTLDTPESATRFFLEALRSDNEYNLRLAVSGARPGIYGSPEWHKLRMRNYASEIGILEIKGVEVADLTANEAQVTVTGRRKYQDQATERLTRVKYQLSLRRETNLPHPGFWPDQKTWRVVPLATDEVLGKSLPDLPPLPLAATLVLQDPRLLPFWYKQEGERLYQQQGTSRLKQLGLGAMQFALDYDEVFALDDAARERAMWPYIKNDTLFFIPGTKEEKWHFNDNLSQKDLAAVAEPTRTVLFYDGDGPQTDKLNFRSGDKTLLCFADGHVKSYSKDELQDILWIP